MTVGFESGRACRTGFLGTSENELKKLIRLDEVPKLVLMSLHFIDPQLGRQPQNSTPLLEPARSGHKVTPRLRLRTLGMSTENPRVASEDLWAWRTLANLSVHESTIRQTLNKNSVYGAISRTKLLLSRKKTFLPV